MATLRIPGNHVKGIMEDYHIELQMSVHLPIDGDENFYINPIAAEVFYYDEQTCGSELCGKLYCEFVNLEMVMRHGYDYFETLDSYSRELMEVGRLFNSKWSHDTKYLKKKTFNVLAVNDPEIPFSENIIYINRLEIVEKHRGKGVGIEILREVLLYFSNNFTLGFFVMKPFPLQKEGIEFSEGAAEDEWQKQLGLDKLNKDRSRSMQKLRTLYSTLGFILVKGTALMVCPASTFLDF